MTTEEIAHPIEVTVKNWADAYAGPPRIKRTTARTYLLDPADAAGEKLTQICAYEPDRVRTVIETVDAVVELVIGAPPTKSPQITAVTAMPEGILLKVGLPPYVFYGSDAMWINSCDAAASRVTVIKEYC